MKLAMTLVLACLSVQSFAKDPEIVEAPLDHVFVPRGFDNNDHVEIVATGKFPNPCFTKNRYTVNIQDKEIRINVSSLFMDDPPYTKCEPLSIPFTEVINLGNLQGGDYRVIVNEGGQYEMKDSIKIDEANSQSVDENIYAAVEYVETGFTGGAYGDALLIAQSPSPCLVLDRVSYLSNNKDTLSVLPIMKKISNHCADVTQRLSIPIKFNTAEFSSEKILLYVRSIDGGSVQKIINK